MGMDSVSPAAKGVAGLGGGAGILGLLVWAFSELFSEAKEVRQELGQKIGEVVLEVRDMKQELKRSSDLQDQTNRQAAKERERAERSIQTNDQRLDALERRRTRR